ncbi:cytochrome c nitrate reductase, small subunit [Thermus oshimai JL-2]|uniref:Cytochrome c nitrate reductase, small subunit n=1 Tax=Thermus oshimai JL-2 TaxID=751945 RepID=K7QXQ5_THEOS|nr:cytochrome c nitrite reductase small subunit [Thermus oshimai]AFV75245.1 cytochrome c nitrate reductase, small subunit [Thermus oshimai JL-2]
MSFLRSAPWLAGLGFILGLAGYAFYQGKGWSYLSNDPRACVNCHIMRDQYESWQHSSHRNWATCNDCHMPHTFLGKWTTKAVSGLRHSVAFTTGRFPEPIVITPWNKAIALDNCVACHRRVVEQMLLRPGVHGPEDLNCTACHGNVGHRALK